MARNPRTRKESGGKNGLTPIPHRIHCPATTERVGGNDGLEQMQVEHFLDTLAEVALASLLVGDALSFPRDHRAEGGEPECGP
jgi:hypothetical protein